MRKLGVLIACLLAVGSATAQSDEYQDVDNYSEAPTDVAVADDPGMTHDQDAADGSESFADTAGQAQGEGETGEQAQGGEYGGEYYSDDSYGGDPAQEEDEPIQLYVGADYVWTTASFSNAALKSDFGGDRFDSNMYRIRAGMRLFEKMGLELHYGTGNTDEEDLAADEYSTEQFYGVYLVPTGVLFNILEVGAAIGYAHTELARPGASENLDGASFGVNFEVPLFTGEALELRIGGGGTVYRAQNSARVYGYHAGVRVDFKI